MHFLRALSSAEKHAVSVPVGSVWLLVPLAQRNLINFSCSSGAALHLHIFSNMNKSSSFDSNQKCDETRFSPHTPRSTRWANSAYQESVGMYKMVAPPLWTILCLTRCTSQSRICEINSAFVLSFIYTDKNQEWLCWRNVVTVCWASTLTCIPSVINCWPEPSCQNWMQTCLVTRRLCCLPKAGSVWWQHEGCAPIAPYAHHTIPPTTPAPCSWGRKAGRQGLCAQPF